MSRANWRVGNRNKAHGTEAERLVGKSLREDGYWVVRAAGSFGPADLVAIKRGELLLIQVKRQDPKSDRKPQVPPSEWNELLRIADELDAYPIVAIKDVVKHRVVLTFNQITGPKDKLYKNPPWLRWAPDRVLAEEEA